MFRSIFRKTFTASAVGAGVFAFGGVGVAGVGLKVASAVGGTIVGMGSGFTADKI